VGALAGCQESGFDESKETQRPLKVQDAMNPLNGTKVPGQAERPATLTADALGDTLAIGVTPVVASEVPDYMRAPAHGVRVVKDTDLDGIRAATPDVILGTKQGQGSDYGDLSKIAPVILTDDYDWKLNLREHGEALGRTNESEKLLIDWDNRLARVKRSIGGKRVSAVLGGGKQLGAVGQAVLDDLGIGTGTGGAKVIRLRPTEEWVSDGGLLGARACLEDVAKAL
jgi:ABC-type Fe3+-hydroxamate transport system substrate-binding protein